MPSGSSNFPPRASWKSANWTDLLVPESSGGWAQPWVATIEGRAWGGHLEILSWLLMADREIARDPAVYEGGVLFLKTSEELPSGEGVFRTLRNMGNGACWHASRPC